MGIETKAREQGVAGGHPSEARATFARQLASLEPVPLRIGAERLDDAVELARSTKLGDLAQAQQGPVGVLAVLAHGLDERKVFVALGCTSGYDNAGTPGGRVEPPKLRKDSRLLAAKLPGVPRKDLLAKAGRSFTVADTAIGET